MTSTTHIDCQKCGHWRVAEHPIQDCYFCERESHDAAFARLREQRQTTHLLGYDPYGDIIYVYAGGVVAAIEARADRMLRSGQSDKLVRRITDLETELRDVLAENARFRRRLEGKPTSSGGTGIGKDYEK